MRILGIDYGDVRTGIAISDPLMITAQGIESVEHGDNVNKLLTRIGELIKDYSVDKIVIGFPINMNATIGSRAEKTEVLIEKIKYKFKIDVEKIDERLTTVSAQKTMTELGIAKKKKKKLVDTIAATYILQTYLDKNKK